MFQYDYNSDGMNELVLATADGIVIFVKNDGSFLEGETFKVGQRNRKYLLWLATEFCLLDEVLSYM